MKSAWPPWRPRCLGTPRPSPFRSRRWSPSRFSSCEAHQPFTLTGPVPGFSVPGGREELPMEPAFVIGLDYGTNSVRAVVVDCADGRSVGTHVFHDPSGEHG